MPYVDEDYYNNEYMGEPIEQSDFPRFSKRASEVIDQLTNYRIKDLENMPEFIQTQIKKAVCSQIEFYQVNGGYAELDAGEDLSNVSIGSFSYSSGRDSAGNTQNRQAKRVSPSALAYLKHTGLLYTGVGTYG